MELSSVQKDININKFADWIGLQTQIGKEVLINRTATISWVSDIDALKSLSRRFITVKRAIDNDPQMVSELKNIFKELASIETDIVSLSENKTKLESETYGELFFMGKYTKSLNFVPHLLSIWMFFRIYILPGMSIILPLIVLIIPYIFMKFLLKIPIKLSSYFSILQAILSGNVSSIINGGVPQSPDYTLQNILKGTWVLVPIVQSVIQPYWTFKHLKEVENIIVGNGEKIKTLTNIYERVAICLRKYGDIEMFSNPISHFSTQTEYVADILLNPVYFKHLLKILGQIEVIVCLASCNTINSIQWIPGSDNTCATMHIDDTFDYNISEDSRKTFSVDFSSRHHSLLTGPNKGGKSTVLRALALSSLLAHTYGCALCSRCEMTPFTNLFVCLKPEDLPGSVSRFEREIKFTSSTLNTKTSERSIVLIDELFHSTNPPDALESCKIYCNQLWKMSNIVSMISTHIFTLVEDADQSMVQSLCCTAEQCGDNILFTHSLEPGICKISSVRSILKENGMRITL